MAHAPVPWKKFYKSAMYRDRPTIAIASLEIMYRKC